MADQSPFSENSAINAVFSDILRSHILTRLDGASLASLSCACSLLYSLCTEESLWRKRCSLTWPSTVDTRVQSIISTFPAGHSSFFYDSFPFLAHSGEIDLSQSDDKTTELISAVDIFYKDTETISGWFLFAPVWFDLLEPKELISTFASLINQWESDSWKTDLEENLSLSWIVIDSAHKRAVNVSTRKPVSVYRHRLTGEVHVKFSTIFVVSKDPQSEQQMEFMVTLVLEAFSRMEEEKAELQLREVSFVAEDMDGTNPRGKAILVILTAAMSEKRRRVRGGIDERKEEYKQFVNLKTKLEEMKWRQGRY